MNLPATVLNSPLVHRVGWTLLHSLWQGAAVCALLLIALGVLRKSRAQARYLACCAAMLALAGLPVATFFLSSSSPTIPETRPIAAAMISHNQAAPRTHRPVAPTAPVQIDVVATTEDERRDIEMPDRKSIGVASQPSAKVSLASIQHRAVEGLSSAAPWIVLLWLVGVAGLSLWNLGAWFAVQQLKRSSRLPVSQEIADMALQLAKRLRLARTVRLLQSAVIDSPLVIGVIKPAILLPASVLTDLPVSHLEALLAHELAHVLRHDYLVNLLQSVVETLLFYHPAVWWISARIRAERENCCDDLAVAVTRDRATYVRALASVAGAKVPALAPAAGGGELLPRLRRLLGKDADASRGSRWLAGALALMLCVAALFFAVPRKATAQNSPTKPTTQPAARSLHISLVDAQTGQPVPGVRGSYVLDNTESKVFNYDQNGQYTIPLKPDSHALYFWFHKDGYIVNAAHFGTEGSANPTIPDGYTVRMQRGIRVGGIVRDEESGKPVEGARVSLDFRSSRHEALGYGDAMTDSAGKWTFDGAPDHADTFRIFTRHPDFIMSSFSHDLPGSQFDKLRDQSIFTTIRRGISIQGVVRDSQGNPVADAEVGPDRLGLISSTKSDAQGHFILGGVEPGQRRIVAIAPGFAPQAMEVVANEQTKPLEIRLEKGRLLRGRVVDQYGSPVVEAFVRVGKWHDVTNLGGYYGRTDADGRFAWDGAPADEFLLVVSKEGYQEAQPTVRAKDDEQQIVVQLKPNIVLRGTVVDDETGAPINKFLVHAEAEHNNPRMWSNREMQATAGKFEVRLNDKGDLYDVRIHADGYLPAQSPKVPGDGPIEFNLRLRKGKAITGFILDPEGKPAVGADVVLREMMAVQADNGYLRLASSRETVEVKTDANGQFTLPPREGRISAVVVHDSGWLGFTQDVPSSPQKFMLHPWAKIEGRLMSGSKPVEGEKVVLQPIGTVDPVTHQSSAVSSFRYEMMTDKDGRFVFDRAVDGRIELYVEHRHEPDDRVVNGGRGSGQTLIVAPGEQKTLQLGGSGRPVIGHLAIPQDLKDKRLTPRFGELRLVAPQYMQPENYDSLTAEQRRQRRADFERSEAYRAYTSRANTFAIRVQPDGTFRADDVPAGDYTLDINVQTPTPGNPSSYRYYARAVCDVHVPEMPGGRSDEPLDVGEVPMKLNHYLDAGAMAPEFEVQTFDGKKLKLSDLRGKYVLLDFWATWCAPCVAGFKDIEKLQHELAGDDRFVILGVSIDEHIAEPTAFLQKRKLPWLQGFAGDLEESGARQVFGVNSIPSLWLIGPDGKIIAKDIDEDKLEQVVKGALGK